MNATQSTRNKHRHGWSYDRHCREAVSRGYVPEHPALHCFPQGNLRQSKLRRFREPLGRCQPNLSHFPTECLTVRPLADILRTVA